MEKVLNCMASRRSDSGRQARRNAAWALIAALSLAGDASGQLSKMAYRALGQPDLNRNGLNRVQGGETYAPGGVALDARGGVTGLYISDTGNHRILGWANVNAYQGGDPPSVVLGQPSPSNASPLGIGPAGLQLPMGLAVDPANGNLYVADTGNHRVLRFLDPLNNPNRVEPDAVYGQADFNGRTANGSGNARNSLQSPSGVAVDAAGNLWIADTGNHRVVRFPSASLNASAPAADVVVGQRDFNDNSADRSGSAVSPAGFNSPLALAFDSQGNLFVSDSVNGRVLRFAPGAGPDSSAASVLTLGNRVLAGGLAISGSLLYVTIPREHRVLAYNLPLPASPEPATVLGQSDLTSREPNAGFHPRAATFSLLEPMDVDVDSVGNVYIADSGNNRVLRFDAQSRSASAVWGQLDFSSNSINQVEAGGMNAPSKIVIDYSKEPFALYISDTRNHRILMWKDAVRFRTGDAADLVIGQPDLRSAVPNFEGRTPTARSLAAPRGIAVDAAGNLYVADSGNHRVLRFPRPADQSGIPSADMVLGQTDFTTGTANLTSATSLRSPVAVAVSIEGNVFVSDTGNNRVLEYMAEPPSYAAAVRVYGQPNFNSSIGPRAVSAQTLTQPAGIAVDAGFNLYVADSGANRVVVYPNTRDAASSSNVAAIVIGSNSFDAMFTNMSGRTRLQSPLDVALDSRGRIYVADLNNNRVLIFPSLIFLPITDGSATVVLGQADFGSASPNSSSRDGQPAADSLAAPVGLFIDRRDTLFIADAGNHRVLHVLKDSQIRHAAFPQASSLGRGSLVRIEGEELAEAEAEGSAPLPFSLADREVLIDDVLPAPLAAVSPAGISLQIPAAAPAGASRIAVRVAQTGELIAGGTMAVATYAPGLYARVLNHDGTTNSESTPALRGSVIRIMGTGQGPVSPAIADGEAAPEGAQTIAVPTMDGTTCLTRQPSVCFAVGTVFGDIRFSGLATGMVGIWQIDVRIPENAPAGMVPVRAVLNAIPSNIITVAIR